MLLLPLSWLFGTCVFIRRFLYRIHVLKTVHFPVPIIVVGNITVGGTDINIDLELSPSPVKTGSLLFLSTG